MDRKSAVEIVNLLDDIKFQNSYILDQLRILVRLAAQANGRDDGELWEEINNEFGTVV